MGYRVKGVSATAVHFVLTKSLVLALCELGKLKVSGHNHTTLMRVPVKL